MEPNSDMEDRLANLDNILDQNPVEDDIDRHSDVDQVDNISSVSSCVSSIKSRSSRTSSTSSLISARLREETRKAELTARATVLKRKQTLALEKYKLKLQAEALELDTKLAIAEAKADAIKKLSLETTHQVNGKQEQIQKPEHLTISNDIFESRPMPVLKPVDSQSTDTSHHDFTLNPTAQPFQPLISQNLSENVGHHDTTHVVNTSSGDVDVIQSVVKHLRKPVPKIKKFSGDVLEYRRFLRQFETKICLNSDSYDEKLNYLDQFTEGEPNKIVTGFNSYLDSSIAYPAVMNELEDRYGNDQILANAFVKRATNWPVVKADNVKALEDFSIFLTECCNAIHSIPAVKVLEYPDHMRKLVSKLPYNYQEKWRNYVFPRLSNGLVSFHELVKFVKSEVKKATDPVYGKDVLRQEQNTGYVNNKPRTSIPKSKGSFVTNVSNDSDVKLAYSQTDCKPVKSFSDCKPVKSFSDFKPTQSSSDCKPVESFYAQNDIAFCKPCLFCENSNHSLENCFKIQKQDIQERLDFLRSKGLCFGCLRKGHMKRFCTRKVKCNTCQGNHPTVCHVNQSKSKYESPDSDVKHDVTSAYANLPENDTGAGVNQCTMAIIPVKVKMKNSLKCVQTYAFLDPGSSVTFATQNLIHTLGVGGKKLRITLDTMGSQHTMNTQAINGLEVYDLELCNKIELPRVYTKDKIPVTKSHIPTSNDVTKWAHLSDLNLPQIDSEISLLIGNNVPDVYTPLEIRTGPSGTPHATQTRLGWVIWGLVRGSSDVKGGGSFSVNATEVRSIQDAEQLTHLDRLVRESFNFDFPERICDDRKEWSREDQLFMRKMEASIALKDGHYYISLPFKSESVEFPNNIHQATKRLKSLKNKLLNTPKFYDDYSNFMTTLFEKDYAEIVPEEEIRRDDGKVWYIPHHGVYHPRKPDKVRVVFDCSATYQGVSLNNMLLQGPDLTNNLIGVLLRFRQESVALMGDVEAMYYQVRIPPNDCDVLRFLWWPEGDLDCEPKIYRMKVHLFGGVSSPSCSCAALRQTAKDNLAEFETPVTDVIFKNFYVDDCLKSVSSEEEGCQLIEDVTSLCQKGGFTVTKWVSNSRQVIESVPAEHRAKGVKELDLQFDPIPSERALGVFWCLETDTFSFKICLRETATTRRGILSRVSSVYDPLGFAFPFVLPVKILLQDLCKLGLPWDQEIDAHHLQIWNHWLSDLPSLEQLEIPRCHKPDNFGEVAKCEIHLFSDASNLGYGVVAYLRLTNTRNEVHCSFVMSKSRVAPLKQMTTPRMELTAAMVAVRISKIITRELEYHIDEVIYWTDSMSVLRYISNDSSRFHTFVANRVAVIRDSTEARQWNFIDSKSNLADCVSRGMRISHLLNTPQWFSGPDFLLEKDYNRPGISPVTVQITSEDPEVNKVFVTTVELSPMQQLIEHCSSWMKLRRMVTWIIRVKGALLHKARERKLGVIISTTSAKTSDLTLEEIEHAETLILKHVQQQHFSDEIHALQPDSTCIDQMIKRSSPVCKLDPYLQDGVLRVGGRIQRADMPAEAKHPIVLPGKCLVSDLILRDVHQSVGHLGKNSILARVRQKYWILGATMAIKRLTSKCVVCKKYQAKALQQKMADLPSDRVTPDEPPFTRVGVDYFGPFQIKHGRSMLKRYGVVFTCLNTRAVHLEIAHSLTTDSCINALRRFIARRGVVKVIISDNGTNLVGCEHELKKSIDQWNQTRINNYLLQKNIVWKFNPPSASHHGGVWERMIRSVRKILYSLMKEQVIRLDDELLSTLFCEVEAILNSRPLTDSPTDPNDLSPLTPNHLLLLHSGELLPPGIFDSKDTYARRRWRQVQYLANVFWSRWVKEYITLLQCRQKWLSPKRNAQLNDIVLVVDNTPRNTWSLGRVINVISDKEGLVRIVDIKTQSGTVRRPVSKVCVISEA